jgi:hypothetical protein
MQHPSSVVINQHCPARTGGYWIAPQCGVATSSTHHDTEDNTCADLSGSIRCSSGRGACSRHAYISHGPLTFPPPPSPLPLFWARAAAFLPHAVGLLRVRTCSLPWASFCSAKPGLLCIHTSRHFMPQRLGGGRGRFQRGGAPPLGRDTTAPQWQRSRSPPARPSLPPMGPPAIPQPSLGPDPRPSGQPRSATSDGLRPRGRLQMSGGIGTRVCRRAGSVKGLPLGALHLQKSALTRWARADGLLACDLLVARGALSARAQPPDCGRTGPADLCMCVCVLCTQLQAGRVGSCRQSGQLRARMHRCNGLSGLCDASACGPRHVGSRAGHFEYVHAQAGLGAGAAAAADACRGLQGGIPPLAPPAAHRRAPSCSKQRSPAAGALARGQWPGARGPPGRRVPASSGGGRPNGPTCGGWAAGHRGAPLPNRPPAYAQRTDARRGHKATAAWPQALGRRLLPRSVRRAGGGGAGRGRPRLPARAAPRRWIGGSGGDGGPRRRTSGAWRGDRPQGRRWGDARPRAGAVLGIQWPRVWKAMGPRRGRPEVGGGRRAARAPAPAARPPTLP